MSVEQLAEGASELTIEMAREDTLSGWIVDALVQRPGTVSKSVEMVGKTWGMQQVLKAGGQRPKHFSYARSDSLFAPA